MKNEEIECYDNLIKKINMLQNTLTKLKTKLNSVYTMCDAAFCEDIGGPDSKDINNERR